ncbi:unnamed protein product, partial [Coccothraustes coccothraustes]
SLPPALPGVERGQRTRGQGTGDMLVFVWARLCTKVAGKDDSPLIPCCDSGVCGLAWKILPVCPQVHPGGCQPGSKPRAMRADGEKGENPPEDEDFGKGNAGGYP